MRAPRDFTASYNAGSSASAFFEWSPGRAAPPAGTITVAISSDSTQRPPSDAKSNADGWSSIANVTVQRSFGPLNDAATTRIGIPLTGSGLPSASSTGEAAVSPAGG